MVSGEPAHSGRENLDAGHVARYDAKLEVELLQAAGLNRACDEHSTFTWLLEPMIRRSGFDVVDSERSDDGIWAKYLLRAA